MRHPRAVVQTTAAGAIVSVAKATGIAGACLLSLATGVAWPQSDVAPRQPCHGTEIAVRGVAGAEAASACAAVAAALTFLAAAGLDAGGPADVLFVDTLPDSAGGHAAFGGTVKSERRIYMLPLATCRGLASALPLDEGVHRALIAHEVGHLVASANFRVARPTVVGHEYIAYVTMFATMTTETRERILKLFPGSGFDSEREIGLTSYLLGPNRFGAQAYRHFMRPGNGADFLQRVLSGRALAVEEPP